MHYTICHDVVDLLCGSTPDYGDFFIDHTSRHISSCRAGLILIHRFPLSLLFHNQCSVPVPIRGYHLQTLLTLHWLPYTSSLSRLFIPSLFAPSRPSSFPFLSTHIIRPHSCYIGPYCTVHQTAKLVAALLSAVGVTAGLAESNGSLPPGFWLTSPAGWLPQPGSAPEPYAR